MFCQISAALEQKPALVSAVQLVAWGNDFQSVKTGWVYTETTKGANRGNVSELAAVA